MARLSLTSVGQGWGVMVSNPLGSCDRVWLTNKKKKSFKMFFLVTYELMNQKRISKEGAGGWNRLHIYTCNENLHRKREKLKKTNVVCLFFYGLVQTLRFFSTLQKVFNRVMERLNPIEIITASFLRCFIHIWGKTLLISVSGCKLCCPLDWSTGLSWFGSCRAKELIYLPVDICGRHHQFA